MIMNKKDLIFTIGLCIFTGIIWVIGEVVMGLWVAVTTRTHIIWFAGIVVVTLVVSVWHSMKDDESGLKDPKREKYERKTKKK